MELYTYFPLKSKLVITISLCVIIYFPQLSTSGGGKGKIIHLQKTIVGNRQVIIPFKRTYEYHNDTLNYTGHKT